MLIYRLPSGNLEFFDSQAANGENLDEFLSGDQDPKRLNGPAGWLGEALDHATEKEKVRIEYNRGATQSRQSESCLLHTLARALLPEVPAKTFVKKADRFFVKHYASQEGSQSNSR